MLKQLTVRNFALVETLDIDFEPGLTVITGESGAGKSILVGALSLVFGERASVELIRPGAEAADVCAEFEFSRDSGPARALSVLELTDADEPQRLLLRRVVHREGRSRAFVNGVPVTLQQLRELTDGLVDIHGQDENVRLSRRDVQLELLDAYGVAPELKSEMRQAYQTWRETRKVADALRVSAAAIEDRAALLRYQLEELDGLALREGEFDQLSMEYRRLSQARTLQATVHDALTAANELDELRRAVRRLGDIDDEHPRLAGARTALASALELIDDAGRDLNHYLEALEVDGAALAELEERLDVVQDLARKHRITPAGLYPHIEALRHELDGLESDRGRLERLEDEAKTLHARFLELAASVRAAREHASAGFASEVTACMNTLGIRGGSIAIVFEPAESEFGTEMIEFNITTNPKYPAGSLARIASGGERARISLAIQVAAAARTALPCLVLDEADVGVGGTTADVLGRLLRDLARHTQVLCITHAPQIAALGEHHLLVEKNAAQDTQIDVLGSAGRTDELARMLAGADVTDKTRAYARTLLDEANATLH